ncbi:23S rRNA (adenine(2503)-C(2))-methyltransferase RlmN [Chloroflexota bacterium]
MTNLPNKPLIYDLDISQIEDSLASWGEPVYRASQIWNGLYINLWNKPEQFTNLPLQLRSNLENNYSFSYLTPKIERYSLDKMTEKILFRLHDGEAVEAVLMKYKTRAEKRVRHTVCISSQVGCALGCVFCATGQMGFRRNLSSGEITEQVLHYARYLRNYDQRITNIVVMGMGEPFLNYDEVMRAIAQLNNSDGFNFGARRFTISTVGIIPTIRRFTSEHRQNNLAVSLHAADDALRDKLLPINSKYPFEELLNACREYVLETGRRITFEWALIEGVNDSTEQALKLAQCLQLFHINNVTLCHVNVIQLNPTKQYDGTGTTAKRAVIFKDILKRAKIHCTIRSRRGIDIEAGCGQLVAE